MENQEGNDQTLAKAMVQNVNLNDWQRFTKKDIESMDLLLLSQFLSNTTNTKEDVRSCLGLCDTDDLPSAEMVPGTPPAGVPKQKYILQLLHMAWEKKHYKQTWSELLSCLEKLKDHQALLDDIRKGHFEGKHDQETIKKYSILMTGPQQINNPHDCENRHLVYNSEGLRSLTDEADMNEERSILVVHSNDPVVQQSIEVYKKLLQRTPSLIVGDEASVPAESDPDLTRVMTVRKNMKRLQRNFASLLRKSYVALKHAEPTLAEGFRVYVQQLCADQKKSISLFEKRVGIIISHSSVEETFLLLSEIGAWDFINYDILESVIAEFKLKGLSEPMEEHKREIATFMDETTLSDYLTVWDGGRELNSMTNDKALVIAKLQDEWGKYTLADVAKERAFLSSGFRLEAVAFQFERAHPGCVFIVWSVPLPVAVYMQEMMESSERPDLTQYGIEELVIGNNVNKICRNYDAKKFYNELSLEAFWTKMGLRHVQWIKSFETVNSSDMKTGSIEWFKGGQLNVTVNCLDRHVSIEPNKERTALIYVNDSGDESRITYKALLKMTCQVANVLKKKGLTKGDTVAIYMSSTPLTVASMLACARIGVIYWYELHPSYESFEMSETQFAFNNYDQDVIFPAYGAEVLKQRLKDINANAIIAVDQATIGKQQYKPTTVVCEVLSSPDSNDGKPTTVLVVQTSDSSNSHSLEMTAGYSLLKEEMEQQPAECTPEPMDSEDILCFLYSSGIGKEGSELKPLRLTQAGYLVYNTLTHKYVFDCKSEDVFCCVAGLGWTAGQICVVYGPLANGETSVLFDGNPYGEQCLKMIQELRVTHFITVPDVYKHLSSLDDNKLQKYDLPHLKVIASAGDVMPPDVEDWCFDVLGRKRCLFLDTYGQTELGGMMLVRSRGNCPSHFPKNKHLFPLFGIHPKAIQLESDREGNEMFELCIENYTDVPCIARNVVEIHPEAFEGKMYRTSDLVKKIDGVMETDDCWNHWIRGRVHDPFIRTPIDSGRNTKYWGIAEVENDVTRSVNSKIGDGQTVTCVIVLPSEPDQNDLYVWVVTTINGEQQEQSVIDAVCSNLKELFGVQDIPHLQFIFTDCVPKTHSGKRLYSLLPTLSKRVFDTLDHSVITGAVKKVKCKKIKSFALHPNQDDASTDRGWIRLRRCIENNSVVLA